MISVAFDLVFLIKLTIMTAIFQNFYRELDMIRFFLYLLVFGGVLYFLSVFGKKQEASSVPALTSQATKTKNRFKSKPNPNEIWFQVYETETLEDARRYQARIQEDDIDCILYEQGKKDIHGNELKGVGIIVPKSSTGFAQGIISRMSV